MPALLAVPAFHEGNVVYCGHDFIRDVDRNNVAGLHIQYLSEGDRGARQLRRELDFSVLELPAQHDDPAVIGR